MIENRAQLILPYRPGTYEASLLTLPGGEVALFHDRGGELHMQVSADAGESWSAPWPLVTAGGEALRGFRTGPVALRSGALGLLWTGPPVRDGRDGPLLFAHSDDGGRTWTEPVAVDPVFAVQRNGTAMVLADGRVLAPVFVWISACAGPDAESENNSLCYSFTYYSDDEGETWHKSGSELFVCRDQARGGCYSFEEPTVAQLADGQVLMYGRTEMGRPYRSLSADRGHSWSWPEPVALASAYAPFLLKRLPGSADLLGVWTQASAAETETGLSRHRLSTAISRDGGVTWEHFRNLESLDDVAQVAPPEDFAIIRRSEDPYQPPTDTARYHRQPVHLRVCYPSVAFAGDEALVTYDFDAGPDQPGLHGTRLRRLPLAWFYGG